MIIDLIISDRTAHAGGFLLGFFAYLVQPTAAFYALDSVAMDLSSRLIAESAKAGGYLKATREHKIHSNKEISLNIAAYLVTGQWNTVQIGSNQLGQIDATVFIQTKMGV